MLRVESDFVIGKSNPYFSEDVDFMKAVFDSEQLYLRTLIRTCDHVYLSEVYKRFCLDYDRRNDILFTSKGRLTLNPIFEYGLWTNCYTLEEEVVLRHVIVNITYEES